MQRMFWNRMLINGRCTADHLSATIGSQELPLFLHSFSTRYNLVYQLWIQLAHIDQAWHTLNVLFASLGAHPKQPATKNGQGNPEGSFPTTPIRTTLQSSNLIEV